MKRLLGLYILLLTSMLLAAPALAQSLPYPGSHPSGGFDYDVALVDEPLYTFVPTPEEAEGFATDDRNADGITFDYDSESIPPAFVLNVGYEPTDLNDALYTPELELLDTGKIYVVAFTIHGFIANTTLDTIVTLVPQDDEGAPERVVYATTRAWSVRGDRVEIPFGISTPGIYRVGICLTGSGKSGGFSINDLALYVNGPSTVPAAPEVSVTAAPKGKLRATLTCVMPTLDMAGTPLDPESTIDVAVEVGTSTFTFSGYPAEVVTADFVVAESGFAALRLTPSNEYGCGATLSCSCYVGYDTPCAPQGLTAEVAPDNLSMLLHWQSVPTVGVNGGYVDPSNVRYRIYRRNAGVMDLMGETGACEYLVAPHDTDVLASYSLMVSALSEVNASGVESKGNPTLTEQLGCPLELPVLETFDPVVFAGVSTPGYEDLSPETVWENVAELPEEYGSPEFADGGFVCRLADGVEHPAVARLALPKVAPGEGESTLLTLRYWDYPLAPPMRVYVRTEGSGESLVDECVPTAPEEAQWALWTLPVEAPAAGWMQFILECDFDGDPSRLGIFDSVVIHAPGAEAVAVCAISGREDLCVGDTTTFALTVKNVSLNPIEGIPVVELADGSGMVICHEEFPLCRLLPMQSAQFAYTVCITEEYGEYDCLTVTALLLDADGVQVVASADMGVSVHEASLPVVHDLQASSLEGSPQVTLSWHEPDLWHGDREDFEGCTPFVAASQIGMWKNCDLDGRESVEVDGLHWEGAGRPQAWHVFDAADPSFAGDPAVGDMVARRFAPYSGTKCLMARCAAQYYEYDCSADWLISPEVAPDSDVSFRLRPLSSAYSERVMVLVSTTDDQPSSFRPYETLEVPRNEAWCQYTFALPAEARHVALAYVSGDGFGVMLDDLVISPVQLLRWELDSYSVWRTDSEGLHMLASGLSEQSYIDEEGAPYASWGRRTYDLSEEVSYCVVAHVAVDGTIYRGPASNRAYVKVLTGVEQVPGQERLLSGGRGVVEVKGFGGSLLRVYTPDGRLHGSYRIEGDAESVALAPGIYLLRIDDADAKVVVQ